MADSSPLRSGRLVVRYQSSGRRRAVAVLVALGSALLLYLIYEWGRFEGGYSKFAEIQRRRELSARLESLQEENERLRAQLAAAELTREVERKAYADVEKDLAELQAQVLKQSEELTFYRGIVSPEDGIGGLRIQRLQILPGGADRHYRLLLVLVQSMRQDTTVSGTVQVQIEGTRENRPERLGLAQVGGTGRADGLLAFRFRYFQNLEHDIVLPEGFEPRAVTVEVRSARSSPVRQSYPWEVQAES
ncbi:MAG TPA: DUF6776 family protein [Steroidobacter sp.]